MVDCCGVRFCAACLTVQGEYSYGRPLCPQCGQPFNSMPDKQLERTLNDFHVHCTHQRNGCWWIGKLGSLSEHLNESPKSERDLLDGCSYQPVKCTRCKSPCQRSLMRNHLEETCSQRDLDCHYRSAGCKVRKPKPELEKHTKEAVVVHLSLLTDHLNQPTRAKHTLICTVNKLDLEVARAREIQSVQHQLDKLKVKQEELHGFFVCLVAVVVGIIFAIIGIVGSFNENFNKTIIV